MICCLMMAATPVWMGVTNTPTNPGLQGNFYFQFIFLQFLILSTGITALWGMATASGQDSTASGSDHAVSLEKKETFAGITIEELNGHNGSA